MVTQESVWNLRFQQLVEYKRAHGDCNVPRQYGPCLKLGGWVGIQHVAKKKNKLSAEREERLNSIGFVWKAISLTDWDTRFEQLVDYKKANGDCIVRLQHHSQNIELGHWVAKQRQSKNKFLLTEERLQKLNSIGFVWRVIRVDWDTRLEQLMDYKKAYGDCNVSTKDSQHIQLGSWVSRQRLAGNKFRLSEEREEKLNTIGFVWNINERDWNLRFHQLMEYKAAVGDCHVPQEFRPNPQLGHFVQEQRRVNNNKNKKLTKERFEKLTSIGFDWEKQQCGWIAHNQKLENKYKEQTHHGLCDNDLPESCSGNNPSHLRKLVTEHRFNNRQNEVLEKESVAEFKIYDNENCWDVHFRELLAYLQTHGDFNVPQCYPRTPLLAIWVSEQRNEYDLKRRGEQTSLTPMREANLDAIGFTWIFGGTEEDAPLECVSSSATVRPEEVSSGTKVKSENNGVAVPASITSG
jgi:glycerol-3-phosphate cytidylyltransferase-like family protein